ncbi:hypothetical protein [Rhizobium straminoryzae]|nr:hypothetical protein [Rhizobium straminoryzae]
MSALQIAMIVVPLIAGQALVLVAIAAINRFWQRKTPPVCRKGGPDDA